MDQSLHAAPGIPLVSALRRDAELKGPYPRSPTFIATYRDPTGHAYDAMIEDRAKSAWMKHPDTRTWSAEASELQHGGLMGERPGIGSFTHIPHNVTLWRARWLVERDAGGDVTCWKFRAPWGWTFEIFND